MKIFAATSDSTGFIILFDELPDTPPPVGVKLFEKEVNPDDLKQVAQELIKNHYDVVVTPSLVRKCGLKTTDFTEMNEKTRAIEVNVNDGIDSVIDVLKKLDRKRNNPDQI